METLIKIQSALMQIERLTLSEEYWSIFEYEDERHLKIKCFYWGQAVAYKSILDQKIGICVYIENSKLTIVTL